MIYSLPSDTIIASFDELDSGIAGDMGVQIQRASNGTVVLSRTTIGINERPAGSGNYVVAVVAPVEADNYLLVLDWSAGTLTPETSRVLDVEVTTSLPVVATGLGPIGDAARSHMGETFDGLRDSPHYGSAHILQKIEVIKNRLMTVAVSSAEEAGLGTLVIDYFGKLVALELMPAAYDYIAGLVQSTSTGDSPTEVVSYPPRIDAMEKVQETLLQQTRRDEATVLPMISAPRLPSTDNGPAIDEMSDMRVTDDPRDFPPISTYPVPVRRF